MGKKFAFLLLGAEYDPEIHRAVFETGRGTSIIQTVRNFDEAKAMAVKLHGEGVGAIEVCGAFGAGMAEELVRLTNREVAIGYVVHDPALDGLFASFFG